MKLLRLHIVYVWFAIFTTSTFISWSSAKEKELYQTPNSDWDWHSTSNGVTGGSVWTYKPHLKTYSVCNILDNILQEPNNWLRSVLIDVQGVQRVDVAIKYTISPSCSNLPSAKFCKDFFDVYAWGSDNRVASDVIPDPITSNSSYKKFANISGLNSVPKTLTIPLQMKSRYLVLGILDQGGCKSLYSVRVTYNICPGKTLIDSLVSLPDTPAPSRDVESITVEGRCTADSVHVQGILNVLCESSGEWNTSRLEGKCICKENMENTGGTCTASNCSSGWVRYGNSCYYIDDTPTAKQTEARTACQNMGADLPIIRSAAGNKFIFDLLKKQNTVTHLGVWLGIHRKDADSKLYWIDDTPLEGFYQNWQLGEPNNYGNDEYCAQMFGASGTWKVEPGKWNDLPCDFRVGNDAPVVLCQKIIREG